MSRHHRFCCSEKTNSSTKYLYIYKIKEKTNFSISVGCSSSTRDVCADIRRHITSHESTRSGTGRHGDYAVTWAKTVGSETRWTPGTEVCSRCQTGMTQAEKSIFYFNNIGRNVKFVLMIIILS
jgi:hypothetical protein